MPLQLLCVKPAAAQRGTPNQAQLHQHIARQKYFTTMTRTYLRLARTPKMRLAGTP
jgi:hypothetical protein